MADRFTRTTKTSWFSRVGSAFAGVIAGVVLIVACVIGLAWNEGNAVKTARGLTEGTGLVIEAPASPIQPAADQKLVHVSAPITVTAPLEDPQFGVTATGVKLVRSVEMYQWAEDSKSQTRTKVGGGEETVTTYTYTRKWASRPIDSGAFEEPAGHQNPEMTLSATTVFAQDARLGDFNLGEDVLGKVGGAQPLSLDAGQQDAIRTAAASGRAVSADLNRIYVGEDPSTPAVGDMRVSYALVPAGVVSVVARQSGDTFTPYRTRAGSDILLVADGDVAAEAMFQSAQDTNRLVAWAVRIGGMTLLMVGFGLILAPLGVLADILPLAGTVVRMGTGLIGFVLGLVVGTVTIALAWLAFRPVTTVIILAAGGALAFVAYRFARQRAAKNQVAEAA